jgi:hypothetical protein
MPRFTDRRDAGRQLAAKLLPYRAESPDEVIADLESLRDSDRRVRAPRPA